MKIAQWFCSEPNDIQSYFLDFQRNTGGSTFEILSLFPTIEERDQLLRERFGKKMNKGALGIAVEWALTGRRPNNLKEADESGIDLKAITVNPPSTRISRYSFGPGYRLRNVLRLTRLNLDIRSTPFEESGLNRKSQNIVAVFQHPGKGRLVGDSIFLGFWLLDVSPYAEESYLLLQQACTRSGRGELSSRCNQPFGLIKPYSHGRKAKALTKSLNLSLYVYKEDVARLFDETGEVDFSSFSVDNSPTIITNNKQTHDTIP